MKNEFLHLILINQSWLLAGLVIYFILSAFKVYLIWYVQAKIYNYPDDTDIFANYCTDFIGLLLTKTTLIKGTIKYLFKYKEADFLLIENKQTEAIKIRINIFNGITLFLKPYLLFAFIWALLQAWISSKILYNKATVTLGNIQQILFFLESIPFIKFLKDNKAIVLLFYGIICILIPFFYTRISSSKKFKRHFSDSLVYLSLLANISFFGVQTGKVTQKQSQELSKLQAQIITIHNKIYKKLIVRIELNDLKDSVRYDNSAFKNENNRFREFIRQANNLNINTSLRNNLQTVLSTHLGDIVESSSIDNPNITKNDNHFYSEPKFSTTSYADYTQSDFNRNPDYSTYNEYMGNEFSWNKEKGESILNTVTNLTEEAPVISEFDKKLEKILDCLFDYGFDKSVEGVLDNLGLSNNKIIKKIASTVFSEKYKKSVAKQSINILNKVKTGIRKIKAEFKSKQNPYRAITHSEIVDYAIRNDGFYTNEENKALELSIKDKINSFDIILPETSDILNRLRTSSEVDAITLLNALSDRGYNNGYTFDDKLDLAENIKKMEREAYFKVFISNFKSSNSAQYNSSLRQYNNLLENQSSNLTLMNAIGITKFIGDCDAGQATICIRCGLPCAFPVCLSRI